LQPLADIHRSSVLMHARFVILEIIHFLISAYTAIRLWGASTAPEEGASSRSNEDSVVVWRYTLPL
jgi:hypothetical protein